MRAYQAVHLAPCCLPAGQNGKVRWRIITARRLRTVGHWLVSRRARAVLLALLVLARILAETGGAWEPEECMPAISAATAGRMCMRQPLCLAAALAATRDASGGGSAAGRSATASACSLLPAAERHNVTLTWMTDAGSFGIRNQWSLESLLRQHPCADVRVVAPLLPEDFFQTFADLGYSVRVVRFDPVTFAPYAPVAGEPGYRWVQKLKQHKSGSHFAVHTADMLRMLVLFKEGGTYMDFNHIVLQPMMHLQNAIGSEICHSDNPDCVTGTQLESFKVTAELTTTANTSTLPVALLARSRFDSNVRFTPWNGVLINWRPEHALYRILLSEAEQKYDRTCRDCLGPRLIGKVLRRGLVERDLFAKLAGSFHVLQPGLLYPFSYETAAAHLKSFNQDTALFMRAFQSIGMHFYGKTSVLAIDMIGGSTMQRAFAANTLFSGNLGPLDWVVDSAHLDNNLTKSYVYKTNSYEPAEHSFMWGWFRGNGNKREGERWIVRKSSERFCRVGGVKIKSSKESDRGRSLAIKKKFPKFAATLGFATFPSGLQDFSRIARQKQAAMLCCKNWLGIREMTFKIATALGLPVLLVEEDDLQDEGGQWRMCELLRRFGVRALAVQGVPPGTLELAKRLHEGKIARLAVVYHSGVAVHNVAVDEAGAIGSMAASALQGRIALAFIEHEQATFVRHLGIPACAIPCTFVTPRRTEELPPVLGSAPLRIGLLGTGTRLAVKNFFTQISAACMFPGAELHINEAPGNAPWQQWYLNFCSSRIVVHGAMNSSTFTHWLGKMHLNMYVSWTDAVPNVVVNSLSAGVPVITSDTSPWFEGSPELKDLLVEPRSDDPNAIYLRAVRALAFVQAKRPDFARLVKQMLTTSQARAVASWNCFVRGLKAESGILCPAERTGECQPLRRERYDPLALLKADGLDSAGATWIQPADRS